VFGKSTKKENISRIGIEMQSRFVLPKTTYIKKYDRFLDYNYTNSCVDIPLVLVIQCIKETLSKIWTILLFESC
jgi:hypothetical protein